MRSGNYPFVNPDGPPAPLASIMAVSVCLNPAGMSPGYGGYGLKVWIPSASISGGNVELVVRVAVEGMYKDASCVVPMADGLWRVPLEGPGMAGWVVSRGIPSLDPPSPYTVSESELEPSCVALSNFGTRSIQFGEDGPVFERNPATGSLVVDLESGYNCELSYDPSTGTLLVDGEPGAGAGRTPASGGYDSREGLLSVNGGFPVNGNIPLVFSQGIRIHRGEGTLELEPNTL